MFDFQKSRRAMLVLRESLRIDLDSLRSPFEVAILLDATPESLHIDTRVLIAQRRRGAQRILKTGIL